jgi:hypothetical protein
MQVKTRIKLNIRRGQGMKTIRLYRFRIEVMRNKKLRFSSKYKSVIVLNRVDSN